MSPTKPKILVVFFSRTGTTKHLAEAIARAEQGELEELRETRSRRGPLGWLRSGYEGTYRRSAATLPLRHELRNYDLIFVGSPTWSRSLSSPVRGFLEQHGAQLKDVAVFATCGGHGAEDVLDQMAGLLREAPLARLPLAERDARRNPAVWAAEFVESAIAAWQARHAKPRVSA
jgi:flavodoxin